MSISELELDAVFPPIDTKKTAFMAVLIVCSKMSLEQYAVMIYFVYADFQES